jgi:hypothetical protein
MDQIASLHIEVEDIDQKRQLAISGEDFIASIDGVPIQPPLDSTETQILLLLIDQPNILHREKTIMTGVFAQGETKKQQRLDFERAVGSLATHHALNGYVTKAKGNNDRYVGLTTQRFSRQPFDASIDERITNEGHRNMVQHILVRQSGWPKPRAAEPEDDQPSVQPPEAVKIPTQLYAAAQQAHKRMREIAGLHELEFLKSFSAEDTVMVEHILLTPRRIFTARDMMHAYREITGQQAMSDDQAFVLVADMLSRLHASKRHEGTLRAVVADKINFKVRVRYDKDPSKYPEAVRMSMQPEDVTMWRMVTNHLPVESE